MNKVSLREKERKKTELLQKLTVVLFFSLFLLYGLICYTDYGISWDEPVQLRHSKVTYKALFLKGQEFYGNTMEGIPDLESYGSNYGVILQLPMVFLEHLADFEMPYLEVFQMRHLYNFLWFFISAIFFYKLGLILTKKKRWRALAGVMIYILCPRILADSFYNVKDLLCLPLFTISMYYGICLIRRLTIKNVLLFLVFSALCTTARVVGGVIVLSCGLVLLVKGIVQGNGKKYLLYFLGVGAAFFGIFVLFTPKAWGHILETVLDTIRTFASYTTWNAMVTYMGEAVWAWELPWHYLFVWIGITVPLVYLLLMGIGFFPAAAKIVMALRNKKWSNRAGAMGFFFLLLTIPFGYVLLLQPVLYNGWRHFYFIYPVIVSFALLGFDWMLGKCPKRWMRYACWGLLALSFCQTGWWMHRNHPHEYVYFAPWIRSYALGNFDLDYWCVTDLECMEYILEQDDSENIKVYSSPNYTWLFDGMEGGNRLLAVDTPGAADYVIGGGFEESYLFEWLKGVYVDDAPLRFVFRRAYAPVTDYSLLEKGDGSWEYGLNNVEWEIEETDERVVCTAGMMSPVPTDMLAVYSSDTELIASGQVRVQISEDGEVWHNLEECPDYSAGSNHVSAQSVLYDLQYVRVTYPKEGAGRERTWQIGLYRYRGMLESDPQRGKLSIEEVTSNLPGTFPAFAKDGDSSTRFTISGPQAGMYVQARLNGEYVLSRARLTLEQSPWDYPRALRIFASLDGESWTELNVKTEDNETFLFSEPVRCRYLRFELGETEEEVYSNWSIYEIELFALVRNQE